MVSGRLFGKPLERRSKNGNAYVTGKIRAATRDGGAAFVNLIAFSADAIAALIALDHGDAVSVCGELTAEAYTDKAGAPQPSLNILVHRVLTAAGVTRRRRAARAAEGEPLPDDEPTPEVAGTQAEDFDDALPF
jgi:single-stranded DNA-binding protein